MNLVRVAIRFSRLGRLRPLLHLDIIIDLSALLRLIAVHTRLQTKYQQVTRTKSVVWLVGRVGFGFSSSASSLSRGSCCFAQK